MSDFGPEHLPDFASQWMRQWSGAAVELARIRDQELRDLPASEAVDASAMLPDGHEHEAAVSGLVVQQQWFMRQALLALRHERARVEDES